MNDALTILRHYTDPESPERQIARCMLQGRSNDLLRGAAIDLACALRDRPLAARHMLDVAANRVTDAAQAFRDAGEECGLVPLARPEAKAGLYQ